MAYWSSLNPAEYHLARNCKKGSLIVRAHLRTDTRPAEARLCRECEELLIFGTIVPGHPRPGESRYNPSR